MFVFLSGYRNHWLSPYTILEKVCFWEKDKHVFYNHEDKPDHKYQKCVDFLNPICVALQSFLDFVHPRIKYVKIDRYDTWNMDYTLALIILPMLKQLQKTKHGAPFVDDADVPDELKSTNADPRTQEEIDNGHVDSLHFKRWDWVLDEVIFAFEHLIDDSWEDQFRSGEMDHKSVPCAWDENGKPTMYQWVEGPNHTYKCDYDGMQKVQDRMQNGFRLFGRYYRNLWD